jgi:hypothetical protein
MVGARFSVYSLCNKADLVVHTIVLCGNEGFLLDKKVGVNQPKRIENAKILIANTSMDADKIKVNDNSCTISFL